MTTRSAQVQEFLGYFQYGSKSLKYAHFPMNVDTQKT